MHAEPKSDLYFGRSLFRSYFVGTHDSFCQILKLVKVLVKTWQSGFLELRPYHKQLDKQSILASFGKKSEKEYTIVLELESKSKVVNSFETIHYQS